MILDELAAGRSSFVSCPSLRHVTLMHHRIVQVRSQLLCELPFVEAPSFDHETVIFEGKSQLLCELPFVEATTPRSCCRCPRWWSQLLCELPFVEAQGIDRT